MRRKWTIGALGLVVAACAAVGASSVLGETQTAQSAAKFNEVTIEVGDPATARRAGSKIVYPLGPPQVIAGSDNFTSNITVSACPAGTKVLNGQFDIDHQLVFVEASHAVGKREWLFRLTDADNTFGEEVAPGDFSGTFGLVCAPNPR